MNEILTDLNSRIDLRLTDEWSKIDAFRESVQETDAHFSKIIKAKFQLRSVLFHLDFDDDALNIMESYKNIDFELYCKITTHAPKRVEHFSGDNFKKLLNEIKSFLKT